MLDPGFLHFTATRRKRSLWETIKTRNLAVAAHAQGSTEYVVHVNGLILWLASWSSRVFQTIAHELTHCVLFALQDAGFYPAKRQHHHDDACRCTRTRSIRFDDGRGRHALVGRLDVLGFLRDKRVGLTATPELGTRAAVDDGLPTVS